MTPALARFTTSARVAAAAATALTLLAAPAVAQNRSVEVTAREGERQSLLGIGAGENIGTFGGFNQLTEERKEIVQDELWSGLGFNALRLWLPVDRYSSTPGERNLERAFGTPYLDIARGAIARGVTEIIVSGDGVPDYMREIRTVRGIRGEDYAANVLRRDMVEEHAATMADYVLGVRDTHGIEIDAITLQNEPNAAKGTKALFYNEELFVEGVKTMRAALDARGLTGVKVVGPETASADFVARNMIRAAQNDRGAWDALGGISTHSYNMAATEEFYDFTRDGDKEYWQTESSVPGREGPDDVRRGAINAGRFLNDMNHGVTHWMHFIGFMQEDPRDDGTRIIKFDPNESGDGWITKSTKYAYFDQLTDTFDIGATFRSTGSTLDGSMTWTFGRKPSVTMTTAENPDGSWAIGLLNFTEEPPSDDASFFDRVNAPRATESFDVSIFVEELAEMGDLEFAMSLSGPDGGMLRENEGLGTVWMRDGRVTLSLDPYQLVTLRSVATAVPEPGTAAAAAVALLLLPRRRRRTA